MAVRAATCTAQSPGSYPNDPGYAQAENATGPTSKTWDGEAWYLYGCIPQGVSNTSTDPEGASGMSIDKLWNRSPNPNKGRDDVIVAYMEGGINWRIPRSCELKDRAWLNKGELPYPQDAAGHTKTTGDPWDMNGDGVFNVEDYVNDPRVTAALVGVPKTPAGGAFLHHMCTHPCDASQVCSPVGPGFSDITPEDLIVAFGHCQINGTTHDIIQCPAGGRFDNDGNGYPNDINGWNFNRDTNDPQTEQSIYEHFTGESAQLVGEGNNNFEKIGLCPLCRYVPIKAGDEAIDRSDRVAEAIVFAANTGVDVMDVTDASLGLTPVVAAAVDYAYHKGMVMAWASNDFESADHTDGMFYPHVWPANSLTGDHSSRNSATCPVPPSASTDAFCLFVGSNNTFRSRSSLTSYGPHALFSVPNNDGSTSTGVPTQAGVAALVVSEGKYAVQRGQIGSPLNADEVKQVVRSTASPINQPCPVVEPCFSAPAGATFNIQYGYGRPNVFNAAAAVDAGHIPPTADIRSPEWYQEVDPTKQSSLHVTADVAAQRATSGYSWQLQYGLGPQPLDNQWSTFASGTNLDTVAGNIDLTNPTLQSFAAAAYSVDPVTRLTIEQYDISVRVQVFADKDTSTAWKMGEDRRAFHLRHDGSEVAGFPVRAGSSGDASPTMADIEGSGKLDTIVPTADGSVHAFRPDGSEAPGFPVHTGLAVGMDPGYAYNYLSDPTWGNSVVPRPHDPVLSTAAVGDLTHTGALDIVVGTLTGWTWAWDGLGRVLPGFPQLNGNPAFYRMSVPPPDTPYSFEPENLAGPSPVLAALEPSTRPGQLDIIQGAGDNHVYAWRPDGTLVPGWPVSVLLPPGTVPAGMQQTHDSKIVPTPAIVDINRDGIPDVVVGLDDSILGTLPGGAGVQAFLLAFDGRGTNAGGTVVGNPALLTGYPAKIKGLIQGYGVAQDFVTQGVESPVVYDDPVNGPQAVVNANLFLPFRVDLATATPAQNPFAATTIPAAAPGSCQAPNSLPPTFNSSCSLVQFTTSATLGKVLAGAPIPQAFQAGSSGTDIVLGITQTPGFGVRVDNGIGGWDPATGASLPPGQFTHYLQGLGFFAAPAIGDVNGDGLPDVIMPADSGALMAFDSLTGQAAAGFPKWTGGWSLFSPAIGDVNGDGHTDVAVATREGYVHLWQTGGNGCTGNSEAWHWHQDDRNTGHYGTDTRPPSAISDLSTTQQGGNDVLSFTAVGDNWKCGTATSYQVFRSSSPITQDNLAQATLVPNTNTPGPSGTHESITVPAVSGQVYYAVRAVDAAGNIGPVRMSATQVIVPESPLALGLPLIGCLVLLLAFVLRRRRTRVSAPAV
jgi:hypothetical protein